MEDRGEGVTVTKKEERNEDSLRISGSPSRALTLTLRGTRMRLVKGPEEILEGLIAGNFPNRGKGTVSQVQAAQRVMYRVKPERNIPRHIVIKMTKT